MVLLQHFWLLMQHRCLCRACCTAPWRRAVSRHI